MIQNDTGFAHAWFRKLGPGGHVFDVLALKATFALDPSSCVLRLAATQIPLRLSDRLIGADSTQPLGLVVADAGDAVLFKPGADVWVTGTACTDNHRPQRRWAAGIGVERVSHIVDLCGPREWRLGLLNWRLTEPEPCTAVALDYRLAFGGHWSAEGTTSEALRVCKPDNPAGCGWIPDAQALSSFPARARSRLREQWHSQDRLRAPQILLPSQALHHPSQQMPTAGLAPIARWWSPRTAHLGTRDAHWRSTHYPNYPSDFDLRYFQAAPTALQLPAPLKGDERIALMGLLPEGTRAWQLPGMVPSLHARLNDGSRTDLGMRLDTLAIDLDQNCLSLTWRAVFAEHSGLREIRLRLDTGAPKPAEPTA